MTEAEIIQHFQIDTTRWEIVKIVYMEHEGYRKDRRVHWEVEDGKVKSGLVEDSGKLRIEQMVGVKVFLQLKVTEIINTSRFDDQMKDAKKFSPK